MWFLYILSWLALIIQVCFITVAVAAGLYYLAELVEEYTVMTKKIIWWMTVTNRLWSRIIISVHFDCVCCSHLQSSRLGWSVLCAGTMRSGRQPSSAELSECSLCWPDAVWASGQRREHSDQDDDSAEDGCCRCSRNMTFSFYVGFFLFEEFPTSIIVCGIVSQVAHLFILQTFPYVMIASPAFIIAVIMLIINHYLAFQYFAAVYYSFSEVISYFTLCLWLVPFALFVSLSANENILPTVAETKPLLDDNDVVSNYFSRKGKKYGLLSLFNYAKDSVLPQRNKKAF